MKFELIIDCDNAAFADSPKYEVATILRRAAVLIFDGADAGTLADINGNTVGSFAFLPERLPPWLED